MEDINNKQQEEYKEIDEDDLDELFIESVEGGEDEEVEVEDNFEDEYSNAFDDGKRKKGRLIFGKRVEDRDSFLSVGHIDDDEMDNYLNMDK